MLTLRINGIEGDHVAWWIMLDGREVTRGSCQRFAEAWAVFEMVRGQE